MIESSMMVNDKMPEYCIERAMTILNREKKSLNGSKVLVLGVAYKKNVDDYRESPAIKVIELLKANGAQADFYDPYISSYRYKGSIYNGIERLDAETVSSYNLVIITTGHTNLDYGMVQKNAKIIFDTRNATQDLACRDNIEVL